MTMFGIFSHLRAGILIWLVLVGACKGNEPAVTEGQKNVAVFENAVFPINFNGNRLELVNPYIKLESVSDVTAPSACTTAVHLETIDDTHGKLIVNRRYEVSFIFSESGAPITAPASGEWHATSTTENTVLNILQINSLLLGSRSAINGCINLLGEVNPDHSFSLTPFGPFSPRNAYTIRGQFADSFTSATADQINMVYTDNQDSSSKSFRLIKTR